MGKKAPHHLTADYADQQRSASQAVKIGGRALHLNMAMQGLKCYKTFRHKKQWLCPLRATMSDLAYQQRTGIRSSAINPLLIRSSAHHWSIKQNDKQDQDPASDGRKHYFTNRRMETETGIPLSILDNGILRCPLLASGVKWWAGCRPVPHKRQWLFLALLRTSHVSWITVAFHSNPKWPDKWS